MERDQGIETKDWQEDALGVNDLLNIFADIENDIDEIGGELSAQEEERKFGDWAFVAELLKTFRLMNSSLNVKSVLEHVIDAAISVVQAERGLLALKNAKGNLEFKIRRDSARKTLSENEFRVSHSFLQKAIEAKELVYVEDVLANHDYVPSKSVQQLQLRSIVCCPLLIKGELVGIFYADSSKPLIGKSKIKKQLFQLFADQAAVAIRNAQLYQKVKSSYEQLEKAHDSLIYAEKMAARGKMAARIGHELNNLLSGIYGNLELAIKFLKDRENVDKTEERLNRVATMIEGMTRFSQGLMANSHMKTKLVRASLNTIAHEFLEFIKPVYKKTGVTFSEEYDPELPNVNVDRGQIQQVLYNLVTNAIEVREDTHITLKTFYSHNEGRIKMSISDTGPGIEKEKLKQIFVPLFTDKAEGHGFGLSICKEIAKKHGGCITVESELGQGTEFTISLPEIKANRLEKPSEGGSDQRPDVY
jgi:signal transduction histidine kinase